MKTQLQLLLSTIALTALIWSYADQAGHETYAITVLVKYMPPPEPGNPMVVSVANSRTDSSDLMRAEITVRGPKSAIRRLERDDAAGRFNLNVILNDELTPGPQPTRDLFQDLSALSEIRNRGLNLQRVSPPSVQLLVDRYKNIKVDLEVTAGVFEQSLVGKPIIKPEQVIARVLESSLEGATTLPPLRISIEEELQARSEQAGGTFSFEIPLHSTWPGIDAKFTPERVRATVRLARRIVSERITLIPLGVLVEPQDFFGQYEIEWEDETGGHFTQAIDVRVPLEKRGQLKGNMIDAYVIIDDADLPKDLPGIPTTEPAKESWIEREIRFVFPAGFEEVRMEGAERTVKFRVKKKLPPTSVLPITPLP